MKTFFAAAAVLSTVVFTSPAMATSYTGHWPFTVTDSKGTDGFYCLAVTDDGSFGWPHSGFGTIVDKFGLSYRTTFQVIGNRFEVAMQDGGGNGQVDGTAITAGVRNGVVGNGVFETLGAGESIDSGKVAFGAKGGC